MCLWCPLRCQPSTRAAWTCGSTVSCWTWTRPSTNTTTSALTPAPWWTRSN
ncbi:hypothetical protein QQF64_001719, partial [Cirrhinus molitorella]